MIVLRTARCDAVEFGICEHGALHETSDRGALEVRQMLAGEEADKVGSRVDGVPVDAARMACFRGDWTVLADSTRCSRREACEPRSAPVRMGNGLQVR